MNTINKELMLTSQNIDLVSEEMEQVMAKCKSPSKERIKLRLQAEETMQFYQAQFGAESSFTFKFTPGLDRHFTLTFPGEKKKPLKDEQDEFLSGIMKLFGNIDNWQYRHNENIVDLKVPKKHFSQLYQIGIAMIFVALVGLLTLVVPIDFINTLRDAYVTPTINIIVSILKSAAAFLILTSIVMSIVNIGDIRSIKKIGKTLFVSSMLLMLLNIVAVIMSYIPWINFSLSGAGGIERPFTDLYQTILDMIPSDPVSPFIEGNAIHIVVLAVFFGVILSLLGKKVEALSTILQEFYTFVTSAVEKISLIMPVFIFLVMSNTILSTSFSGLAPYRIMIIMLVIGLAIQLTVNLIFVLIYKKGKLIEYFKEAKAPLLVTLLTSSSAAALPSNLEACKKGFKLNEKIADFGVPIGQVLFKPGASINMLAVCFGVAYITGTSVSPAWIFSVIVVSILLAIATPPIAGGPMMIYSLLFAQMKLPTEYLGISLTLAILFDSIITTLNSMSLHYLLLGVDKKVSEDE